PPMPRSVSYAARILQREPDQDNLAYLWATATVGELNKKKIIPSSSGNCVKCQKSDSITNSISNATGKGGESESSAVGAGATSVNSGSAILCSVNSANNTRKLNLIPSREQSQSLPQRPPPPPLAVGTNLQNKLPASSADCHLSPSAETNIHTNRRSLRHHCHSQHSSSCPYHRHRHYCHRHYRHRRCWPRCCFRCRCRCRCRAASQSASAAPASMHLPYQINQRATLLQQSATAAAAQAAQKPATSTTLPHVHRIFKRKRDTAETATTASPLTPPQHPTSTTSTPRSRLEFILYTEVYEVEDSVSSGNSESESNSSSDLHSHFNSKTKSSVGSDETFWQKYGE
ncbi:hypothetical protein KR054_007179, partial [Drosophila jambulina]